MTAAISLMVPAIPATIGDRLREYVLRQLDQADRALLRRGTGRHDGVRVARKTLRRIRAVLDLGPRRLASDGTSAYAITGMLCRRLSRLRDAHAAVETLDDLMKTCDKTTPQAPLRRIRLYLCRQQGLLLRETLVRDPGLARYRQQLRRLREIVEALPWSGISRRNLQRALERSERRVGRMAGATLGSARHRWRRRLRRLRLQMMIVASELSAPCFEGGDEANSKLVRAQEFLAELRLSVDTLKSKSDALGFERDLCVLRGKLRNKTDIMASDRTKLLRLVRDNLAHLSRQAKA